ncbi:uncharacterized protein LOC131249316 isoform X2 [Magnolia sinica]|uniref:uncharacterized protein LOC131249316 isoform X2 n=1 Tax=Magnolia sinica TaxID=86752 RepID=UPI0026587E8B|nr:uncharacterized protein LOC131249316 isoform X2 [Magnolia sinica]
MVSMVEGVCEIRSVYQMDPPCTSTQAGDHLYGLLILSLCSLTKVSLQKETGLLSHLQHDDGNTPAGLVFKYLYETGGFLPQLVSIRIVHVVGWHSIGIASLLGRYRVKMDSQARLGSKLIFSSDHLGTFSS